MWCFVKARNRLSSHFVVVCLQKEKGGGKCEYSTEAWLPRIWWLNISCCEGKCNCCLPHLLTRKTQNQFSYQCNQLCLLTPALRSNRTPRLYIAQGFHYQSEQDAFPAHGLICQTKEEQSCVYKNKAWLWHIVYTAMWHTQTIPLVREKQAVVFPSLPN